MQGEEAHAQSAAGTSSAPLDPHHQMARSVSDTAKKTRRTRGDIEKDWYSVFSRWDKADRTAALKVLGILHDTLPDNPRKPEGVSE